MTTVQSPSPNLAYKGFTKQHIVLIETGAPSTETLLLDISDEQLVKTVGTAGTFIFRSATNCYFHY